MCLPLPFALGFRRRLCHRLRVLLPLHTPSSINQQTKSLKLYFMIGWYELKYKAVRHLHTLSFWFLKEFKIFPKRRRWERKTVREERVPDSRNCPSFLSDSAGGLGLPPKASGRGAPRPSSPLVLPEQHDGERRPAWAQRERPHGRLPAVQEPPRSRWAPAAGLGCRPAKASPSKRSRSS